MGRYEELILGTDSDTVSFLRLIHTRKDSGLDQGENTGDGEKWSLFRVDFEGRSHRIWRWISRGSIKNGESRLSAMLLSSFPQ